uniref:Uncharacterized protein n=1 Tax=Arundo donax TaxID=35708 RepID=A0A0A9A4Q5_ARUDO
MRTPWPPQPRGGGTARRSPRRPAPRPARSEGQPQSSSGRLSQVPSPRMLNCYLPPSILL